MWDEFKRIHEITKITLHEIIKTKKILFRCTRPAYVKNSLYINEYHENRLISENTLK